MIQKNTVQLLLTNGFKQIKDKTLTPWIVETKMTYLFFHQVITTLQRSSRA